MLTVLRVQTYDPGLDACPRTRSGERIAGRSMSLPDAVATQEYGKARVQIHASQEALGAVAAQQAAGLIRDAIAQSGRARIVVATGNSQLALIGALARQPDVDW